MTGFISRLIGAALMAAVALLTACISGPDEEDSLGDRLEALKPLALLHDNFPGPSPVLLELIQDPVDPIIRGIINDPGLWEDIWITAFPDSSTRPPLPQIDFVSSSVIVLVAFDVQFPGPRAELDSLVIHENGIRGYDVLIMPPPGILFLQVPAVRTSLVLVPKVESIADWRNRRA